MKISENVGLFYISKNARKSSNSMYQEMWCYKENFNIYIFVGTERIINTKSTTVVDDIIDELCNVIGVETANEKEEFSLYCIVEGETFTVPLSKDHYILDVTTELQRDGAIYYLIFCR